MKTKVLFVIWVACLGALVWFLFDSERPLDMKPIYNESVDGAKQIGDALVIAKKENKRVLLQFGANWCVWCHRLHQFFETDKAVHGKLQSDFVVVLVDVDGGHNGATASRYCDLTQSGLPTIAILDSNANLIAATGSPDLVADDGYDSKKILAFLNSSMTQSNNLPGVH